MNSACATRVIVDDGENVTLDLWAVNFMQMRYARGLLLNCRPCLTKVSCCIGLKRYKPEEISTTTNGNTKNRKIEEENHFSLHADFVLIIARSPFYNTHVHLAVHASHGTCKVLEYSSVAP